ELGEHRVVDHDRLAEALAAVDDPVRDRVRGDVVRLDGARLAAVDERQLEARRAGVDDEDQPGHVKPETTGSSSPCSRVYARARRRVSSSSCRRCAALVARPGTRSITSMTRWKRSRSFSITMSNGVVVVPSSL